MFDAIGGAQVSKQTIGAHRQIRQRPHSFRKGARDCLTRPPHHMRADEFGNRKWVPRLTTIFESGYTFQKQEAALRALSGRWAEGTALAWLDAVSELRGAAPRPLRAPACLYIELTDPSVSDSRSPSLKFFRSDPNHRLFGLRARRRPDTPLHGAGNPDPILNSVLSFPSGDDTHLRRTRR
jgi:hypothetical protein